ncbi:lipocalin-like domain-containing protein [uncultured Thiothrix sp.]|uniref:lipocalin-like domain-containing protein n=1 Tax=uncultured Thiothrix sp. TaxID=223185 RepID=UPI002605A27E|nr:lipocalin-like domain-containing protein [uncultured Thiothrix sp.]HMT91570.1 lipocalin-like domain-containing protein [Thiolinea sp.]
MVARLLLLGLLLLLSACEKQSDSGSINLNAALGGIPADGFARAVEPRPFTFPQEHAAHPEFRNEWWYITGNLQTERGRQFGYQVTFFRIALSPNSPQTVSNWATNQVWMAHIALTDVEGQKHLHDQRFARGAAGLAGQKIQPFKVWLEDWQILGQANGDFPWTVQVANTDFSLKLTLQPEKPAVLQGKQGLSQKSSEAGNASYYYSFTRLASTGSIHYQNQDFQVTGSSWLDREWSTSALGKDQAGWDWFSLQFKAGQELMFYQLHKTSGEADQAYSQGKWIAADASTRNLSLKDVELQPLQYWQATNGTQYPIVWELNYPAIKGRWRVEAVVDDQLMETSVLYWEGAVRVLDLEKNQVVGQGYLELSGY